MENSLMRKNGLALIIACIMLVQAQCQAMNSENEEIKLETARFTTKKNPPLDTWFLTQISIKMFDGKSVDQLDIKDLIEVFRVIFADLLDKTNNETFVWHIARLDAFRNVAAKRIADKTKLKTDYEKNCRYYITKFDIKSVSEFEKCINIIAQNINILCHELAKPANQTVSNSSSILITCLMTLSKNLPTGLVNRIQSTQGKTNPIAAFGQLRSALRHRISVQ